MSRPTFRVLPALLVLSAVACAGPTAPVPARPQLIAPTSGASFDDVAPDTTCRSGYINAQGRTC